MPFKTGNRLGGRTEEGEQLRKRCRKVTEKAVLAYIEALDAVDKWTDSAGVEHSSPDHETRMKAATHLLDRGYGKPAQAVTGVDDQPIKVDASSGLLDIFKKMAEGPKDGG